MRPRLVDSLLRLDALVEDRRGDRDQGGAEARAAGGADREHEAALVEREARRHHALHPVAGLERTMAEVGLAEHAVQVEVEAGEPVPGAESEARGQDAGAAVAVDRDEVGRVRLRSRRAVERCDEREQPLGGRQGAQARQPGERGGDAGEAAAREEAQAEPARLDRLAPRGRVRGEVGASEQAAAFVGEGEQRLADRARVDARRALLGERLERGDEPGLFEPLACPQQRAGRCVHARSFAQREHGREHLEAGRVCRRERHPLAGKP